MEPELMTLAASGATALVGLMVDDAWTATKARVLALFGRGRADAESVDAELEESRGELVAARDASDEQLAADVEAVLRTRLRRLLQQDPDAAEELRALIAEADRGSATPARVTNVITGADIRGSVFQTGSVEGGINIGDGRRSS